jgi:hypothetical protein
VFPAGTNTPAYSSTSSAAKIEKSLLYRRPPCVLPFKLVSLDGVKELVVVIIFLLVVEAELPEQSLPQRLLVHYVVVSLARQAVLKVNALRYVRKVHQLAPFLAATFTVI